MSKTNLTEIFWREFCTANAEINNDEPYQVWFFSNNSASAKELVELVLRNTKTATASLVLLNEIQPENAPILDGYSVVTDFEGNPRCVIQTTEIRHLSFDEVDAQFAFDEGEGDRSLEDWQRGHWKYFIKEAENFGIEFNEKSLVCCERFRLIFPKI